MPFKTPYGKHYHMTEGCHGATIPCSTDNLIPCSDCCNQGQENIAGISSATSDTASDNMNDDSSVSTNVSTHTSDETKQIYNNLQDVLRYAQVRNRPDGSQVIINQNPQITVYIPPHQNGIIKIITINGTDQYMMPNGDLVPIEESVDINSLELQNSYSNTAKQSGFRSSNTLPNFDEIPDGMANNHVADIGFKEHSMPSDISMRNIQEYYEKQKSLDEVKTLWNESIKSHSDNMIDSVAYGMLLEPIVGSIRSKVFGSVFFAASKTMFPAGVAVATAASTTASVVSAGINIITGAVPAGAGMAAGVTAAGAGVIAGIATTGAIIAGITACCIYKAIKQGTSASQGQRKLSSSAVCPVCGNSLRNALRTDAGIRCAKCGNPIRLS